MYVIKRNDGLYLTDGKVYPRFSLPQPIWQDMSGTRELYLEGCRGFIIHRKEKLEQIYTRHKLEVVKLNDDQLAYLSFRKLRGY